MATTTVKDRPIIFSGSMVPTGAKLYMPHFVTCSAVASFRKARGAK